MFRTARITFQEAGHEPVTDVFRVWFIQDLRRDQQAVDVYRALMEQYPLTYYAALAWHQIEALGFDEVLRRVDAYHHGRTGEHLTRFMDRPVPATPAPPPPTEEDDGFFFDPRDD